MVLFIIERYATFKNIFYLKIGQYIYIGDNKVYKQMQLYDEYGFDTAYMHEINCICQDCLVILPAEKIFPSHLVRHPPVFSIQPTA